MSQAHLEREWTLACRRHKEVQKGSRSVADWMLKRGEGMMKSKKAGEEKYNGNSIFTRHGQTVWNVENKICGATDSPLTDLAMNRQ